MQWDTEGQTMTSSTSTVDFATSVEKYSLLLLLFCFLSSAATTENSWTSAAAQLGVISP